MADFKCIFGPPRENQGGWRPYAYEVCTELSWLIMWQDWWLHNVPKRVWDSIHYILIHTCIQDTSRHHLQSALSSHGEELTSVHNLLHNNTLNCTQYLGLQLSAIWSQWRLLGLVLGISIACTTNLTSVSLPSFFKAKSMILLWLCYLCEHSHCFWLLWHILCPETVDNIGLSCANLSPNHNM